MLVLSRKEGQSIVIAGEIVVNIIDIGRGRVQVGITAPPHLTIHREEIHRRIDQERLSRASAAGNRAVGAIIPPPANAGRFAVEELV